MKLLIAASLLVVLLATCGARVAPRIADWHKFSIDKPLNLGDIWKDCSAAGDKGKILSVSINPDPPKKGENLSVKANISLSEDVTGGSLKVSLMVDKIPFVSQTFDLCDEAPQAGLQCPIKAGQQTLNVNQEIPEEAPHANYSGKQYLYDQNNNELFCIELMFRL